MPTELENAINVLKKALAEDKSEGSYYYSWQANIAMAFYDVALNANWEYVDLHEVSNQAAKNFLDLLIKTNEITKIKQ